MAFTRRNAMDRVLQRLQVASGAEVQVYAEEPLREIIQHKVDALVDIAWWPQLMTTETFTLSAGLPLGDLSTKVKRFSDIRFAYLDGDPNPLPRLAHYVNPSMVARPCITPNGSTTQPFKIMGNYNGTACHLVYRNKPDAMDSDDDEIPLDEQLVILGAAYDYLNGLGTGTNEEDKVLRMFEARLDSLLKQIDQLPVDQYAYEYHSGTGWEEVE
jgi:hypothetical protein